MAGTIDKSETLISSTFEQGINFDYSMSVGVVLKGLTHTSQTAFMEEAAAILDQAGYSVGQPAPSPYGNDATGGFGLEVTSVRIQPISVSSARCTIFYGTPAIPATTAEDDAVKWVWESNGTVRAEQQAWDVAGNGIAVKYWPQENGAYWDAAKWNLDDNQRRFNQTHVATKYRPWETCLARARIRWDWIQLNGATFHPRLFNNALAGNVNGQIYSDSGRKDATKGIWLCQGAQVSTPNNGLVWDVRVQFARNNFGWDTVLAFEDPNNQNKRPKDIADRITAQPKFKLPYPDDADRILQSTAPDTNTGGAVRPKMHKLFDFKQSPYFIDLTEVTE